MKLLTFSLEVQETFTDHNSMDATPHVSIQGKQVDLGLVRDTDHWYRHNKTQGDKINVVMRKPPDVISHMVFISFNLRLCCPLHSKLYSGHERFSRGFGNITGKIKSAFEYFEFSEKI